MPVLEPALEIMLMKPQQWLRLDLMLTIASIGLLCCFGDFNRYIVGEGNYRQFKGFASLPEILVGSCIVGALFSTLFTVTFFLVEGLATGRQNSSDESDGSKETASKGMSPPHEGIKQNQPEQDSIRASGHVQTQRRRPGGGPG
jgi:hypothetical protein